MIGGKYAFYGSVVGFIGGIVFTILSLFQYDSEMTNLREVLMVGIFIGTPITVLFGYIIGLIIGKFTH